MGHQRFKSFVCFEIEFWLLMDNFNEFSRQLFQFDFVDGFNANEVHKSSDAEQTNHFSLTKLQSSCKDEQGRKH